MDANQIMRDIPAVPIPEVPAVQDATVPAKKTRVWKVYEKNTFRIIGDDKTMADLMKTMTPGVGITVMMINTACVDLQEFFADGGMLVSTKDIR